MRKQTSKLFPDNNHYFQDEAGNVYFNSIHTGKLERMKGVTIANFCYLDGFYSSDGTRLYYESKLLKKSYQNLHRHNGSWYFTIDESLYWGDRLVQEKFQGSVQHIAEHFYTDGTSLFVNGNPLSFDRESFQVLNKFYAKDKNTVFLSDKVIVGTDAASFQVIPSDSGLSSELLIQFPFLRDKGYSFYACDHYRVYDGTNAILEGLIDPASVQVIQTMVIRDKKHIYYCNTIVECYDPDSFQPIYGKPDRPDRLFPAFEQYTPFYRDKVTLYYLLEDKYDSRKSRIVPLGRLQSCQRKPVLERLLDNIDAYNLSEIELSWIYSLSGENRK
ncbi:DKNYY domain-containing protein [Cytophagaceae bacterium DM2B3-1]|uniref:DKNYY domain-containing protein n=1 Tax=Xanthocytophaga flava TaxID=3048013 RepID=A0ABT7CSG6_9BACT|nr:DKNYY domain-containing protein [Xanthocytophaga flavus]MDJ1496693.1 DKNYY domain-containing protein [Xanthocytophaga flavus]